MNLYQAYREVIAESVNIVLNTDENWLHGHVITVSLHDSQFKTIHALCSNTSLCQYEPLQKEQTKHQQ